jgi:putative metallohydrolase (TIGR04338 family)
VAEWSADDLYAAEAEVEWSIGRDLTQLAALRSFVDEVLAMDTVQERFPSLPESVNVEPRSRTARSSVAVPLTGTIFVHDKSRNALTVLHELAHLLTPSDSEHGPLFVDVEIELVRLACGVMASAELALAFARHGVVVDRARWRLGSRTD